MSKMYRFCSKNCLVNVSNSILAHYELETYHPPMEDLVKRMEPYKKIVVLLFDGMASSLLKRHLKEDSFLRKHVFKEIDSIFPPTTVAATDALLSGKYPKETLWLGWSQYFKEINMHIDVFSNRETFTKELSPYKNPMDELGKYERIFDIVAKKRPSVAVKEVWPKFRKDGAQDLEEFLSRINDHLLNNKEALLYGYWDSPDHEAHDHGVNSIYVKAFIEKVNDALESLTSVHKDTLFIVLADHSLVDVEFLMIDEHKDFYDTLKRPFAIEPRAATFFVKRGRKQEFVELFNKYYGEYFDLYSKQEVKELNLFGYGKEHKDFDRMLGDFLAVSTSKYCFDYVLPHKKEKYYEECMIGAHAGGTEEEFKISLILIN